MNDSTLIQEIADLRAELKAKEEAYAMRLLEGLAYLNRAEQAEKENLEDIIEIDALKKSLSVAEAERDALAGKLKEAGEQLKLVERVPRVSWEAAIARAEQSEAKVKEFEARLKKSEASLEAIAITDGKAREVVKELLGVNPDGAERMWFETSQRLMAQVTDLEAKLAAALEDKVKLLNRIGDMDDELDKALEANKMAKATALREAGEWFKALMTY